MRIESRCKKSLPAATRLSSSELSSNHYHMAALFILAKHVLDVEEFVVAYDVENHVATVVILFDVPDEAAAIMDELSATLGSNHFLRQTLKCHTERAQPSEL